MKLTRKQILAGFGGKRALAGIRARRSARKAAKKAPKRRTNTMARRTRRGRRGSKKPSIIDHLVNANAAFQLLTPLVPAAQAAMAGNGAQAATAFKAGVKESLAPKNLAEAGIPYLAAGLGKKALRAVGAGRKKIFGYRIA